MSSDNYYVIVPNPAGGFSPVMRFASEDEDLAEDEDAPVPVPLPRRGAPVFATPMEALHSVLDEYAEYGHSIHPACTDTAEVAFEDSHADGVPVVEPDLGAEIDDVRAELDRARADVDWLRGAVADVERRMREYAAGPHVGDRKDVLAFANLLTPLAKPGR